MQGIFAKMKSALMNNCIFCRIIKGELPAVKVYEDDTCIAFFPLKVINPGHVLLVPKAHFDNYIDLPSDQAAHLAAISQVLGRRITDRIKPARVGYAIVGFEVSHVHIHIVPMNKMYEITSSAYAAVQDGEIVWSENNLTALTETERVDLAALLGSE